MQNISYFSGNIGNWQMSGFCQKLTANVTWWDIDDPFYIFSSESGVERGVPQRSKHFHCLIWACKVRYKTGWSLFAISETVSENDSAMTVTYYDCHLQSYRVIHHTTPHHTTPPPLRSAGSEENFLPRWIFYNLYFYSAVFKVGSL